MVAKGSVKESGKKERKKKPNELLSSVVRETAPSAALELLRENTQFVLPGGNAWGLLMLDAENIGGLNAKMNNHEDKGMLIQLIDDDQIQTVATEGMLEEEHFGIIPSSNTLERMEEFSLLVNAEYSWAIAEENEGAIEYTQVSPATYAQAVAVFKGEMTLQKALGEAAWAEYAGDTPQQQDSPTESISQVSVEVDPEDDLGGTAEPEDEDPLFSQNPEDFVDEDLAGLDDAPADEFEDEVDVEGLDDFEEPQDTVRYEDPEDSEDMDDEEDDEGVDDANQDPRYQDQGQMATQEVVYDTIVRRFLKEDLDLEIDVSEFYNTFSIGLGTISIEVPEGASEWLSDQITHLTRQANASLRQQEVQDEESLKVEFVKLTSLHAEQVAREVSIDREGSRYKKLSEIAEESHHKKLRDKDDTVRAGQIALVEAFEKNAESIGEQAKAEAMMRFRERNKNKLQREQLDVVTAVSNEIEASHTRDQQEILRVRRMDAMAKMELGVTPVFEVLQEIAEEQRAGQRELMREWTSKIEAFVADHRAADMSRVEVLAEDQARANVVADAQESHDRIIRSMQQAHTDRTNRMEEELSRVRNEAIQAQKAKDAEWQHQMSIQQERVSAANQRADEAYEQMQLQTKAADDRAGTRYQELVDSRDNLRLELEAAEYQQTRSVRLMMALMAAIGVICLGSGALFVLLVMG